jgi:hypothetical protein
MANQMIALQARGPQLPDPSRQTAQYANMMNMARQAEAAQLQGERTRQDMEYARAAEGRAVAGEGRAASKFKMEQATARVSAVGTGLIGMLRDPSDANLAQTARTFAAVGMDPEEYTGVLSQMAAITDPNARKLYALEFITQSEPARAALKYVMPNVKETKIGDDVTVFTDDNANSATFGQELFRFRVSPKPDELNQQVVGDRVFNINKRTGVAAEAPVGDPYQGLAPAARETTFTSSGVISPYAVGGGTGQQPMMPSVAPTAPPAQAVGIPVGGSRGAPGQGGDTFSRMIRQESRGKQFDRNGRPLTSSAGAIGIAQVMPGTAPEAAKLAGLPFDQNRYRTDEAYNLALGKAYYEKQLRDFGGDERLAAAAYNAGPGAVRSALQKGGPNGWINNVPLETRKYIRSVFGAGGAPTGTPTGTGTPAGTGTGTGTPVTVSEAVKLPGKRRVSSLVADMLKEYDKLNNAKAIGSSGRGVAENIFDYLSVSAPGQEIQKMFGTKANDSLSNLTSSRKLLASAMAAAMGLSSKQADSNTELQLTLASLSDATQGYKAVTDILKRVDREYGMGTASTRTPTTGGGQGKGRPSLDSFRRKK